VYPAEVEAILIASLLSIIAALLPTMALVLPDDRPSDRLNPAYWAMILPICAWAYGLVGFSPWALRLVNPALWLGAAIALAVLAVTELRGYAIVWWAIAAALALGASTVGFIAFRKSALHGDLV
jgi:hypothetical protein